MLKMRFFSLFFSLDALQKKIECARRSHRQLFLLLVVVVVAAKATKEEEEEEEAC